MPSLKKIFENSVLVISLIVIIFNVFIYLEVSKKKPNEDEVVSYLMDNPANLESALSKINSLKEDNNKKNIHIHYNEIKNNHEFFLGNKNGETIIIEFFDYNCGYCKRSFPELMELIAENKDIKVILKELPVLGESSILASKAAIASLKQDKYFAMHQELINFSGQITINDIIDISKRVGINHEQLKNDMNKDETVLLIKENYRLADLIGVRGTPAFIINKELIPGAIGKEDMIKILKNGK